MDGIKGIEKHVKLGSRLKELTKETLVELYWRRGLSVYEIAERYELKASKVTNKMKRLKIPFRRV